MNNPWFLIETWITQVSIWVKTKFWCWECDYPSEIAENCIQLCPETVKIFLVFILMSTPLFCLLIPYMGNREVCLEYCTGIRSNHLLQLRVVFETYHKCCMLNSHDFACVASAPFDCHKLFHTTEKAKWCIYKNHHFNKRL